MILRDRDLNDLERVLAVLLHYATMVRTDGVGWCECEQAYQELLDIISMIVLITGTSTERIRHYYDKMLTEGDDDYGEG